MSFVSFMKSPVGRGLRIAFGALVMLVGINQVGGTLGVLVAAIGVVPIAAGVFNFCLAAPLFGFDINGRPRAGGVH
jgi:hypothetical protein